MDTTNEANATTTGDKSKSPRKPKSKPATGDKSKRSLNLSLPHEDYQRLALHALDRDMTISELVSELARTHLRSVHITRTATRTTNEV